MKLLRFGNPGEEKPGLFDAKGNVRDLSGVIPDLAGAALSAASLEKLRNVNPEGLSLVTPGVRIGPCVGHVGKFVCIGLNYSDHATETGMKIPSEPIIFMKATWAI